MPSGPKFLVYDLKTLKSGSTVVVRLSGSAANVRLMDSTNYHAYKSGRNHRVASGSGLVRKTPHRIVVPRQGHWYVTVDNLGLRGSVRAGVSVEPPPMAAARSASASGSGSLASLRHDLPSGVDPAVEETWDVFICHAGEDKSAVALPLASALKTRGVKVWIDVGLRIGDSLRRKIDEGLSRSRFGIVVFSKSFFRKEWPQYELDGIVTRTLAGKQVILPIWHEVTEAEMIERVPSLADKVARDTATWSIDAIAEEIAEFVLLEQGVV